MNEFSDNQCQRGSQARFQGSDRSFLFQWKFHSSVDLVLVHLKPIDLVPRQMRRTLLNCLTVFHALLRSTQCGELLLQGLRERQDLQFCAIANEVAQIRFGDCFDAMMNFPNCCVLRNEITIAAS